MYVKANVLQATGKRNNKWIVHRPNLLCCSDSVIAWTVHALCISRWVELVIWFDQNKWASKQVSCHLPHFTTFNWIWLLWRFTLLKDPPVCFPHSPAIYFPQVHIQFPMERLNLICFHWSFRCNFVMLPLVVLSIVLFLPPMGIISLHWLEPFRFWNISSHLSLLL